MESFSTYIKSKFLFFYFFFGGGGGEGGLGRYIDKLHNWSKLIAHYKIHS